MLTIFIHTAWVIFWIVWIGLAYWARYSKHDSLHSSRGIISLLNFIVIVVLFRLHIITTGIRLHGLIWRAVGTLLFLGGLTLCFWARFYLGRNWGAPMSIKTKPQLITRGTYRYIRHPIYSGFILASIGTALAVSLGWLWATLIGGGYFIYSAVIEERTLLKTFPVDYLEYKKRSKMLIPFIF